MSARPPACSRTTTSARRPASTPSSCSWTTARSRRSQPAARSSAAARVSRRSSATSDQLRQPVPDPGRAHSWCGGDAARATSSSTIGRRNVEGGGRIDDLRHTSFRGVVGLRGDIADGWNYDVYGLYGTSILSENYQNDLSRNRVGKALNAVVDTRPGSPTSGQTVCRVNADVDLSNDDPACVPWNIFQAGGVTPEQLAYLQIPGFMEGSTIEQVLSGSISGDLGRYGLKLPTANDGLGVRIRRGVSLGAVRAAPGRAYQSNDLFGQGAPTLHTTGGFDVSELFAELRVPILQDQPLAQTLSLETGYRYSDYNLGFDTDSYKLGLDWAPVDSVRLRGSYQRAVRSPNVQELFLQPRVQLNGGRSLRGRPDQCDHGRRSDSHPRAVRALRRDGRAIRPHPREPGGAVQRPRGRQRGASIPRNRIRTRTASCSRRVPADFSLSLDYYDIKVDKLIGSVGHDFILGSVSRAIRLLQQGSPRRVNGSLWLGYTGFIEDPIINTGSLAGEGRRRRSELSLRARPRRQPRVERCGHLDRRVLDRAIGRRAEVRLRPGCTARSAARRFPSGVTSCARTGRPRWGRPDADLALHRQRRARCHEQQPAAPERRRPFTDRKLGSRNYFDLAAHYTLSDASVFSNVTGRLGINNLLDKDPPLVGQDSCPGVLCNGNTFPQVYDTLGRLCLFGTDGGLLEWRRSGFSPTAHCLRTAGPRTRRPLFRAPRRGGIRCEKTIVRHQRCISNSDSWPAAYVRRKAFLSPGHSRPADVRPRVALCRGPEEEATKSGAGHLPADRLECDRIGHRHCAPGDSIADDGLRAGSR